MQCVVWIVYNFSKKLIVTFLQQLAKFREVGWAVVRISTSLITHTKVNWFLIFLVEINLPKPNCYNHYKNLH